MHCGIVAVSHSQGPYSYADCPNLMCLLRPCHGYLQRSNVQRRICLQCLRKPGVLNSDLSVSEAAEPSCVNFAKVVSACSACQSPLTLQLQLLKQPARKAGLKPPGPLRPSPHLARPPMPLSYSLRYVLKLLLPLACQVVWKSSSLLE